MLHFGISNKLVQEGKRHQSFSEEAEGRRKERLYSKPCSLFQLDSYFRHGSTERSPNVAALGAKSEHRQSSHHGLQAGIANL